jgi:hypothetical protein
MDPGRKKDVFQQPRQMQSLGSGLFFSEQTLKLIDYIHADILEKEEEASDCRYQCLDQVTTASRIDV